MARGYRFGVVGNLSIVPDGSTVLPTDDIQIWLKCASIKDKTYTTLSQVLADSTTLQALISSNNAVDYMVRSTTWASGVTADSGAMTLIGANNYASNTLLGNLTWLNAIYNSTYFESVLNVKVPTMTSDTTPSGEVSSNSVYDNLRKAFKAFDGNTNYPNYWLSAANVINAYLQYQFTQSHKAKVIKILEASIPDPGYGFTYNDTVIELQGSNDGTSFTKIDDLSILSTEAQSFKVFMLPNNETNYQYYRLQFSSKNITYSNGSGNTVTEMNIYGRQDV